QGLSKASAGRVADAPLARLPPPTASRLPSGSVCSARPSIIGESSQTWQTEGFIMETATMGKVLVTAKIENLQDLYDVARGLLKEVRRVEVTDALADTGAMMLSLPKALIQQLGL